MKIWWFRGVNRWDWKGQYCSNCHKNADLCSLETSLSSTKFLYRLVARSKRKACSKSTKKNFANTDHKYMAFLVLKNFQSQQNLQQKNFFFIFFDVLYHFEQIKKFEKKILKNFEVPKKIEPKKKVTYSMCFFHVSSHGEHFSPWNFLSHFWNIFFLISLILGFWGVNYWGWTGQFWSIRPKNTDLFSLETPLWPTKFVYRLLSWLERNGCPKTTNYTVFATLKHF